MCPSAGCSIAPPVIVHAKGVRFQRQKGDFIPYIKNTCANSDFQRHICQKHLEKEKLFL